MKINTNNRTISHKNKVYSYNELLSELKPHQNDVVYLAGSIVEGATAPYSFGMGNELSDIDVFIIREHDRFEATAADYVYKTKKIYFLNNILNGLDIEIFDSDYVTQLTAAIKNSKVKHNERISSVFQKKLEDNNSFEEINSFLCRLKYSICIYNFDKYNEVVSNIDFEHFSNIYINHLVTNVDNILPDVYGNLEWCQFDVALYCMRNLCFYVMKIVLSKEGVFVDRSKWVPLKMRNMVYSKPLYLNIWKDYVSLFRSDISDDKACKNMILNVLADLKQEIEKVLLGGVSL